MKKIFSIFASLAIALVTLTSCEDIFNNLEGDLTKISGEQMASSEAGLKMLLAQVYSYIPMNELGYEDQYTLNACDSHGGDYGFNSNPYYGMYGVYSSFSFSAIRSINAFIENLTVAVEKGVITTADARQYTAEARFVRAYYYFVGVRSYGGLPIITRVLDPLYDGGENKELFEASKRATEKETWDFILKELDEVAADLAPESVEEYRANKYAALGLKARVALYAASVSKYWDRQGAIASSYKAVAAKMTYMDKSYASDYYNQCITACEEIINSGKFSLYGAHPASVAEAVTNLGDMFLTKKAGEYIFGRSLNDGVNTSGSDFDVYNSPAQTVTGGGDCGRYSVTIDFVDKFDNYTANFGAASGVVPTRVDGKENVYFTNPVNLIDAYLAETEFIKYDKINEPFINKDARFQAWILYPDCEFRNQTIKIQGGIVEPDGKATLWAQKEVPFGGVTYYSFGDANGKISGFSNYLNKMAADVGVTTGFSIRKFLDPAGYQLYHKTFRYDIRYAEILLSYCEAVVENGVSSKEGKAKEYLNDIRHRAAFKDDVDLTLDEVLHQRELEFAFEGDQLYTMHRRRAFYNQRTDDPVLGNKHALTPILDLSGDTPQYFFLRTLHYAEDGQAGGKTMDYHTENTRYYKAMPDYGKNRYEPNPIDE